MLRGVIFLITALTLSPASAGAEIIACSGTEPFWSMELSGNKMTLSTPATIKPLFFSPINHFHTADSSTDVFCYDAPGKPAAVAILRRDNACSDGMSETHYDYQLIYSGLSTNGSVTVL